MPQPASARVALVMSYPYEAFAGGEGAYVSALRRYLVDRGHRIDTLISDVTRGRFNPLVRLPRAIREAGTLQIRRATAIGGDRYLSRDPLLLARCLGAMAGRRHVEERHDPGEIAWLTRRLARGGYDAVILMWDASRHAATCSRICHRTLALRGFCVEQLIELGKPSEITVPPAMMRELEGAPLIGMNNLAEVREVRRLLPTSTVIHVGMGFAERRPLPDGADPVVLFVGADTVPNRKALDWLLNQVWPGVASVHPHARLRIVGAVAAAADGRHPSPSIERVGRVESIEAEYANAQVVVTPLVLGSAGVKTKVAEALAFGRPLVSTSLGADPGAPDQFGEAVDIADDPEGFVRALNRLLADPELRAQRSQMVREAFRDTFSNASAYAALSDHLEL